MFSRLALLLFLKRERETKKASTVNTELARIRKVAKAQPAFRSEIAQAVLNEIFKGLTRHKPDRKVEDDKYLTENEVKKLIAAGNEKEKLFVRFLVATGLRVNEMLNIKLSDITTYERGIVKIIVTGKGNKDRAVTVQKSLIRGIRKRFGSKVYLFETTSRDGKRKAKYMHNSIYRILRNLGIKAGVAKTIGVHIFRHTFATLALKNGKSLKWVSQALGHSTTAITADMYIHENHLRDMAGLFDF